MKPSTNRDEELSQLLARLPAEGARRGFTRRVMERLERPPTAPVRWRMAIAAAAAAVVLGLALFWAPRPQQDSSPELVAEARQMRREVAALERELAALRELAEETAPVVYLGQQDDFDLVVDLRPLLASQAPGARHASYPEPAPLNDGERENYR